MTRYICTTCGVQYSEEEEPPKSCIICEDERQYVNPDGQEWTSLEKMQANPNYHNVIQKEEKNLYSIRTKDKFGIGQTAYLVQSEGFNILWDCLSLLDEATIERVSELGGIDAIALSHPHYYSTQVEWAEAFQAPIYIHEDDQEWVMRESHWINYWSGEELKLTDYFILSRLGGHFKGGAVLNWTSGNSGKGILLSGDIIQIVPAEGWVSFMYSYPNLIPLPASKVEAIAADANTLHFDRIYNAFHHIIVENGKESVQKSADRYIKALNGELF
ncbi:MAG: hypothetical protein L0I79_01600 [Atopostipes sp.]|nr:hypothetical protein [Atopostipes sp.]